MKATRTNAIDGTSLQGEISTTKAQLIATFGAPNWETTFDPIFHTGEKVTTEWAFVFEDGTLATIYDWKRYEQGSPDLNEVYSWHIGGFSPLAVERVTQALTPKKSIKRSLFVEAREWFDKVNGNSYFSARVWVDGEIVTVLPFQYGYGNQNEHEAQKKLIELGYLPQESENRGLWSIAAQMGFDYYHAKTFTNKKEMFK
jgi:hypothetical protein